MGGYCGITGGELLVTFAALRRYSPRCYAYVTTLELHAVNQHRPPDFVPLRTYDPLPVGRSGDCCRRTVTTQLVTLDGCVLARTGFSLLHLRHSTIFAGGELTPDRAFIARWWVVLVTAYLYGTPLYPTPHTYRTYATHTCPLPPRFPHHTTAAT